MKITFNIIYLYILKVLFHIFSFFANVSNGGRYFVKKKILIGTILIAASASIQAQDNQKNNPDSLKQTSSNKTIPTNDSIINIAGIEYKKIPPIDFSQKVEIYYYGYEGTCYAIAVTVGGVAETIDLPEGWNEDREIKEMKPKLNKP